MTTLELAEIKKIIILTAVYYGRDLAPEVIGMMAEDLADLPYSQVRDNYTAYRRNPKNRAMPLPAQIRDLVAPEIDDDTLARDAASRIIQAISKYGYINPVQAREFMGNVAWSVVERQGGWVNICESFMIANTGIWQAQFRDLARAQMSLARAGRLDTPPELPEPSGPNKALALASMIKDLNERKEIK